MIKKHLSEIKELMQEWDYEANKDLDPTKLTVGSKENVLWKCSKCGYHWHAMINGRYSNHTGCPACANKVFAKGYNDLETIYPEIAKEWHPTMNGDLTPSDVKPASLNRVWWLCPICNNAYQKRIMDRVKKGSKCNKCCDPKVIQGKNDIATKFPDLLKEWNYEKNYPFLPQNFSYGSTRKFWWKCSKCNYEWMATALNRNNSGFGCPVCKQSSGAIKGLTDLETTHPELAKEWDYENNKNLTPEQVKAGSGKNVWWKCPKCHCSYKTQIIARVKGRGCPNCKDTGVVDGFNDFQTLYPNLVKEWHPTKNTKKPNQIKSKSKYNAFWICPTCGLVWQAPVVSRVVQGRDCPACNDTSLVPGVNDLATKFSEIAKEWHSTKNGDLTPKDVKYGSRKKVWWKCSVCSKEWETTIDSRTRQLSGCP